jgi:hypothetical protein
MFSHNTCCELQTGFTSTACIDLAHPTIFASTPRDESVALARHLKVVYRGALLHHCGLQPAAQYRNQLVLIPARGVRQGSQHTGVSSVRRFVGMPVTSTPLQRSESELMAALVHVWSVCVAHSSNITRAREEDGALTHRSASSRERSTSVIAASPGPPAAAATEPRRSVTVGGAAPPPPAAAAVT